MTSFRLLRLLRLFFAYVVFIAIGSSFIVWLTVGRIQNELRFHRLYGSDWVAQYEKYEEPLVKSNILIGVGAVYVIGLCIFVWWVYRRIALKQEALQGKYPRRRRRRRHRKDADPVV